MPGLTRRYREFVVAVAVAMAALASYATGGRVELVDGLFYDLAAALAPGRPRPPPAAVIVALDAGSLDAPELATTPRVFFGPQYARVLDGLFDAGAKAVGFDIILSFAASRFGAIDPAYDAPLQDALGRHKDATVLARTATTPIATPFVAPLYGGAADAGRDEPRAIAYSELVPSADGVHRWIYPSFKTQDGVTLTSLAARLTEIAGAPVPAAPFLLVPAAPLESQPTYAFVDVLRCLGSDPAALRRAFAGKVVLIGGTLPEEDRKRAPDRFLRWPAAAAPAATPTATPASASPGPGAPPAGTATGTASAPCQLAPLPPSSESGYSVPGVHVHAAAVDAMVNGRGATLAGAPLSIGVGVVIAGVCAVLGLLLSPVVAVGALLLVLCALFSISVLALGGGVWLPVAVPGATAIAALLGGQVARYLAGDRRRKRLEDAFGCYLAPAIVGRLAEEGVELKLGGEERNITVMFADLTNFTTVSDQVTPPVLMELTNRYFKIIVDVIDESGGYVDKFIGDSVMALWGAPVRVPDAPARALQAALTIQERVRALNRQVAGAAGGPTLGVKMGMASGPAIVGNVGTPRRLSYTALGATINLAARLEKVCTTFGCPIVVDEATMAGARGRYLFCELDTVQLKGKLAPVAAYEALAAIERAAPAEREYVTRYEAALAAWRAGDARAAVAQWEAIDVATLRSASVLAPRVMVARVRSVETADDPG